MNVSKRSKLVVFFAILSLNIPLICYANPSVGFFSNAPLAALFVFLSIWIIETDVVNRRFAGSPWRALASLFVANAVTSLMGIGVFVLGLANYIFDNFFKLLLVFGVCYLISVLIEGFIIRFFYKKETTINIFRASALMNLQSHIFISVFVLLELLSISPFLILLMSFYFFNKIYCFIVVGREFTNFKKAIIRAITIILSVVLCVLVIGGNILWPGQSTGRSKARDARRLSDMRQLISAQEKYYTDNGFYYSSNSMPTAIGNYLVPVPTDPSTGKEYGFLSNAENSDKFCYFAVLENEYKNVSGCADGCKYYSATQAGNFYLEALPGNFDECDQKSSYNRSFIE